MKRLILISAVLLFFGSCSTGYKMPAGFEQELRTHYAKWQAEAERPFNFGYPSYDQRIAIYKEDSIITQKYGLREQAIELGYFAEEQQPPIIDTVQMDWEPYEEYMRGWVNRNTTPEYQNLIKNSEKLKKLTIDEIIENDRLLPIEKLMLVRAVLTYPT